MHLLVKAHFATRTKSAGNWNVQSAHFESVISKTNGTKKKTSKYQTNEKRMPHSRARERERGKERSASVRVRTTVLGLLFRLVLYEVPSNVLSRLFDVLLRLLHRLLNALLTRVASHFGLRVTRALATEHAPN